jgi:hypothetical protein
LGRGKPFRISQPGVHFRHLLAVRDRLLNRILTAFDFKRLLMGLLEKRPNQRFRRRALKEAKNAVYPCWPGTLVLLCDELIQPLTSSLICRSESCDLR